MSSTPQNKHVPKIGTPNIKKLHEPFVNNIGVPHIQLNNNNKPAPSNKQATCNGSRNLSSSTTGINGTTANANHHTKKKTYKAIDGFDFDPLSSPRPTFPQNSSNSKYSCLHSPKKQSSNSLQTIGSSVNLNISDISTNSYDNDTKNTQSIIFENEANDQQAKREDKIQEVSKKDDSTGEEEQKLKEAAQLATVFLEMRETIMTNHHVDIHQKERAGFERNTVKAIADSGLPFHRPLGYDPHQPHQKISKATIQRAERVKAMMNLYYFSLLQCQKLSNPQYANVDGIYNPLQIIRNRKVKKRYEDYQESLSIRLLPYASTAFSQRKDRKKFVWEVDLTEIVKDCIWRSQHWNELIDPYGELWYPPEDDGKKNKHRHRFRGHHHHHHHRPHSHDDQDDEEQQVNNIHNKLFDLQNEGDIDTEYSPRNSMNDTHISDTDNIEVHLSELNNKSNSATNSKEDIGNVRTSRTLEKLNEKIRRRSKSPFKKLSATGSPGFGYLTSINPELKNISTASLNNHCIDNTDVYQSDLALPYEPQHDFFEGISIEPIKAQRHDELKIDSALTERELDQDSDLNEDLTNTTTTAHQDATGELRELNARIASAQLQREHEQDMEKYLRKLTNLSDLLDVSNNFFQIKSMQYQAKISRLERFENQLNEDADFIQLDSHKQQQQQKMSKGTLSLAKLSSYEFLLTTLNKSLEDYKSGSVSTISNDLEKYLLNSDRNIGEINTTLSLELRKLNEKFEKISYNFKSYNFRIHSNIHRRQKKKKEKKKKAKQNENDSDEETEYEDDEDSDGEGDDDYTERQGSRLTDGAFEDVLYWVVENLVVVLLWFIWFVFWSFKVIKFAVLLVWECVKWLLF